MSAKDIITKAGKAFGLTYADMIGKDRRAAFVHARAATSFALRARGMSYPQIGRCLNRDHSTIINYVTAHSSKLDSPDFAKLVESLKAMPMFVLPDPALARAVKAFAVSMPPPKPKNLTPRQRLKAGEIDGDQMNEAEFNAMLVRGSRRLNETIASQFRYQARAA